MKPRPDNVLMNLPEEDRHQLNEWLLNNSYAEVKRKLAQDRPEGLGVQTNISSLRRYYEAAVGDHLIDRRDENVQSSTAAATAIAGQPATFDIPNLDFLKQRFWKLITASESPVLDIARLYRLILKTKDQEFARERFEYNVAEIALKHASALRDIATDPSTDTKEKRRAARLQLFGILTNQEEPITHHDRLRNTSDIGSANEPESAPTLVEQVAQVSNGLQYVIMPPPSLTSAAPAT